MESNFQTFYTFSNTIKFHCDLQQYWHFAIVIFSFIICFGNFKIRNLKKISNIKRTNNEIFQKETKHTPSSIKLCTSIWWLKFIGLFIRFSKMTFLTMNHSDNHGYLLLLWTLTSHIGTQYLFLEILYQIFYLFLYVCIMKISKCIHVYFISLHTQYDMICNFWIIPISL